MEFIKTAQEVKFRLDEVSINNPNIYKKNVKFEEILMNSKKNTSNVIPYENNYILYVFSYNNNGSENLNFEKIIEEKSPKNILSPPNLDIASFVMPKSNNASGVITGQ